MTTDAQAPALTEPPGGGVRTLLEFPLQLDLDALCADFAVLGVPHGKPYGGSGPNEQSRAPDALRAYCSAEDVRYTREHYDYDLGGYLLDGRNVSVVDCGNVSGGQQDPEAHYRRAAVAAGKIFSSGAVLIGVGGDHGVTIPLLRGLEVLDVPPVTLVHVDAHLDWREDIGGEREGYSSPIRRAAEMPWIGRIVQVGMRGIGSARQEEVDAARAHGSEVIDAYELHRTGMEAVLGRIPDGGPYYLTIDADGLDPTIMPAVMAPTPGGLNWAQVRQLVHGLVRKGPVLGMDLVEIAPAHDLRQLTLVHAERLICNFIGASVRAGRCREKTRGRNPKFTVEPKMEL
jgi:agmatinase